MKCILSIAWLGLMTAACQPGKKTNADEQTTTPVVESAPVPYALDQPDERYKMPDALTEISGLSYYKPGRLACIQDELAVVFIYDLASKSVVDEHVFGKKGDYEGVEYVDGELYALRSDGELYQFTPVDAAGGIKTLGGGGLDVHHIKIDLPGKNDMEGLGYDPKLKALLLMTKTSDRRGTDKTIFYYGLEGKALYQGPILKQADLQAGGDAGDEVKPSGLAVHPKTGEYYVLASAGRRLLVLTPAGKLKSSVPLSKSLFPQPEGIYFAPDGTLFIASEGDGGSGRILRFAMK